MEIKNNDIEFVLRDHKCKPLEELLAQKKLGLLRGGCDCSSIERGYRVKIGRKWLPVYYCPFCGEAMSQRTTTGKVVIRGVCKHPSIDASKLKYEVPTDRKWGTSYIHSIRALAEMTGRACCYSDRFGDECPDCGGKLQDVMCDALCSECGAFFKGH